MQQADACQEITEMNHVAALLRRHGYTSVIVVPGW